MNERIHVISLGVGDAASLSTPAWQALLRADVIIGDHRFRPTITHTITAQMSRSERIGQTHRPELTHVAGQADPSRRAGRPRWRPYPKPFSDLPSVIEALAGQRIVILASGDALFYGVGSLLRRQVDPGRLTFHPNVSSLQSAMHALGLPWQDLRVVSLHGRPLSNLRAHLAHGELLGVFTDEHSHPAAIARELLDAGFAQATIQVCENLGAPEQKISGLSAMELAGGDRRFHPLNVCIVDLPLAKATQPTTGNLFDKATRAPGIDPGEPARTPSLFPGIADEHFSTGSEPGYGMISKREVRLAIVSLMEPCRGEVAWDIGAGCGSVSVEWARANPGGHIHAIEIDASRLGHLDVNRERFGVTTNCLPLQGEAPGCCAALPVPQCIFIGGNMGQLPDMLDFAWARLGPGGKLVASAVTADSQRQLEHFLHRRHGEGHRSDWCEIAIRKSLPGSTTVRELRPVNLLRCIRTTIP